MVLKVFHMSCSIVRSDADINCNKHWIAGSRKSRGKIMSISNIEVMPICGTAVSLDICDSTNKFEKISEGGNGSFNLYRVVDKV